MSEQDQADVAHQPVGPGFVLEHSAQRLLKFGAVVLAVAWLLTSEDLAAPQPACPPS